MIEMEVRPIFTTSTFDRETLEGVAYEVYEVDADKGVYNILIHGEKFTENIDMLRVVHYLSKVLYENSGKELMGMQDPFVELWWDMFMNELGFSELDVTIDENSDKGDVAFSEKYGIPVSWVKEYWKLFE